MLISQWIAGFHINNNIIYAIVGHKTRKKWYFSHYLKQIFCPSVLSEGRIIREDIIREKLQKWRHKLPKNVIARLALPVELSLQNVITLPQSDIISHNTINLLIKNTLKKTFPQHWQDLIYDYRLHDHQLIITVIHHKIVSRWLSLFQKLKIRLTTLDIAPCALRYFADQQKMNTDYWLIYQKDKNWIWIAPSSLQSFYYGAINDISTFTQVLNQLPQIEQNAQSVYLATENSVSNSVNEDQFNDLIYRWPEQINPEFLIAAGMVVRPEDKPC